MGSRFLSNLDVEEISEMHGKFNPHAKISNDDIRLSHEVPIVVSYDLVDMGTTAYNFSQHFEERDTQEYFTKMKIISFSSIDDLTDKYSNNPDWHFHRTNITGNIRKNLKQLFPNGDFDNMFIYHFSLYTCQSANRERNVRAPRIYFLVGRNGIIYILFFDPYHELNPIG